MSALIRLFRYDWPLHIILWLTNWLPDNVLFLRMRGFLAHHFIGSCGKNLRLGRNITFYNPSMIHLGNDIYIAYGGWFLAGGNIQIGDEVMFGPYTVISAGNHTRVQGSYRYGPVEVLPVSIGKGSWIGAHVSILGGAMIGKGCMVGSNACVVRGTIPDNSFIAGIPAVIKKEILDECE